MSKEQTIQLRGYVRQTAPRRFVGVCLTLNLVVEGTTLQEARGKLDALVEAYIHDAERNNEFDAFVPRRAPLSFYLDYFLLRLWRGRSKPASITFSESLPLAHA